MVTNYAGGPQGRERPLSMELFEITPAIVGGDPIDPQNKVWLTRQQHIEATRYWNRMIRKLREDAAT